MTRDVLPLERTASAVTAAHAAAADETRLRRRRIAWTLGVIVALLAAVEILFYPRTQAVHVTRRRVVDVYRVTRNAGIRRFFRHGDELGTAMVVQYFSGVHGTQAQGLERYDVFEWARPLAEREGIHFIVVSRMEPVLTRWVPFQRYDVYPFRQKADGTWGGL
jgi:hypothetical protein